MINETAVDIYNFIKQCIDNGYPPTVREICLELNIKSTSTVHRYVKMLVDEGYLEKDGNQNRALKLPSGNKISVPLVGEIAAGTPILAIENITEYISFTADKYYSGELFALKIKGDSMINIGIFDGDTVIIEKTDYAENGDLVAALVDDEYATVKTFYKENRYFRLQPENDDMQPIISRNVRIIGKVATLIRYF